MKELRIVLLSAWGADVALWAKKIIDSGLKITAIIMDGDKSNLKNRKIIEERTGGFYVPHSIVDLEAESIPIFFVKNHNNSSSIQMVKKLNTDVLINAGTPRIIKSELLEAPRIGILNSHPGLLPQYRGCTVVEWALYNRDLVGATCHFMDGGIDHGPIVYKEEMKIVSGDSYERIRARMVDHAAVVMAKGLTLVITKCLKPGNLPAQENGNYYPVMDEDKLNVVKNRYPLRKFKHI